MAWLEPTTQYDSYVGVPRVCTKRVSVAGVSAASCNDCCKTMLLALLANLVAKLVHIVAYSIHLRLTGISSWDDDAYGIAPPPISASSGAVHVPRVFAYAAAVKSCSKNVGISSARSSP